MQERLIGERHIQEAQLPDRQHIELKITSRVKVRY